MKKIILCMLVLISMTATAQVYDTIWGRSPNYHYSTWYDTCPFFFSSPGTIGNNTYDVCLTRYEWSECDYLMHVDSTMQDTLRVKGLSCMVSMDWKDACSGSNLSYALDTVRLPEYLYLGVYLESKDSFIVSDSLRWDTVTPKVMMLPKHADTSYGFEKCWVYEVFFAEPITLCGKFHIAGSYFSNCSETMFFHHYPTFYCGIDYQHASPLPRCVNHLTDPLDASWYYLGWYGHWSSGFGLKTNPFHVIVQPKHLVDAQPCDSTWGRVVGGGQHYDSTYITLTAVPSRGYAFTHWDDGDTTNPRTLFLTSDTALTAYFDPKAVYRVDLSSDYPMLGAVAGDGLYYDGDTATIQAIGSTGLAFVSWNDGDTANPRQVLVTRDTAFMAHFRLWTDGIDGILPASFVLKPNPAKDYVTLTCQSGTQRGEVMLRDALGKELRRVNVEQGTARIPLSDIPAGVYLVALTTDQGTSLQRLVVE